jgi:hypothetical protein
MQKDKPLTHLQRIVLLPALELELNPTLSELENESASLRCRRLIWSGSANGDAIADQAINSRFSIWIVAPMRAA